MSAVFSDCGRYRYRLDRELGGSGPPVAFLLHNPSTAGGEKEDATSRRGIGFANAWGAVRLTYINPWAGVATKKTDLWCMADPVGLHNLYHIEAVTSEIKAAGGFIVCAWGDIKPPAQLRRVALGQLGEVIRVVRATGSDIRVLGLTLNGSPRHPLYLPASAVPTSWRGWPDMWPAPDAEKETT